MLTIVGLSHHCCNSTLKTPDGIIFIYMALFFSRISSSRLYTSCHSWTKACLNSTQQGTCTCICIAEFECVNSTPALDHSTTRTRAPFKDWTVCTQWQVERALDTRRRSAEHKSPAGGMPLGLDFTLNFARLHKCAVYVTVYAKGTVSRQSTCTDLMTALTVQTFFKNFIL